MADIVIMTALNSQTFVQPNTRAQGTGPCRVEFSTLTASPPSTIGRSTFRPTVISLRSAAFVFEWSAGSSRNQT